MSIQVIEIDAQTRETLGTRQSRRLRKAGRLPAVIYGHGQDNTAVTLPMRELRRHLEHGSHVFSLKLDATTEQVLLKDVQYDSFGEEMLHVDLFRVSLDEVVTTSVPVHLVGELGQSAAGGSLQHNLNTIEVRCKVLDIPDEIRADVSKLTLNEAIHASDLKLPDGVELETEPNIVVAIVKASAGGGDEDVTEAGEAEPELIGKAEAADEGSPSKD